VMDNDEKWIEAMLGRCRPKGPGEGLEERIFSGAAVQRRLVRRWWLAAAAGLVLAVGGGWVLWNGERQGVADHGAEVVVREAGGDERDVEVEWAEIKRAIFEAKAQAQLLAAADLLAKAPGGQDEAGRTYEYLMERYPETEAAREAAARREDLLHRRSGHEKS